MFDRLDDFSVSVPAGAVVDGASGKVWQFSKGLRRLGIFGSSNIKITILVDGEILYGPDANAIATSWDGDTLKLIEFNVAYNQIQVLVKNNGASAEAVRIVALWTELPTTPTTTEE